MIEVKGDPFSVKENWPSVVFAASGGQWLDHYATLGRISRPLYCAYQSSLRRAYASTSFNSRRTSDARGPCTSPGTDGREAGRPSGRGSFSISRASQTAYGSP